MANDIQSQSNSAFDYSMFGGTNGTGQVNQVWGADAVANSIKMWMASFRGEQLRNPLSGGYLVKLITKPMNQIHLSQIQVDIAQSLQNEFSPYLTNIQVSAIPNYAAKYWSIEVDAYCPVIKNSIQVTQKIKNIS